MSRATSTVSSFALIAAILVAAYLAPLQWGFLIVMSLMLIFCVLLGLVICKDPLGILISDQNVISLSRFQTVLWTVIIISALLVIAMARIKNGVVAGDDSAELGDPLNIILGKDLLALFGITAASLVGSPLIAATKKSKTAAPRVAQKTARDLVQLDNVPDSVTAPGSSAVGLANVAVVNRLTSAIQENAEDFCTRTRMSGRQLYRYVRGQ